MFASLFKNYPKPVRRQGDGQVLNYAAQQLLTAAKNTVVAEFTRRLMRACRCFCHEHMPKRLGYGHTAKDKEARWAIACAIMGRREGEDPPKPPAKAANFIKQQRDLLGLKEGEVADNRWLKKHVTTVLIWYAHVLGLIDARYKADPEVDIPRFSVLPLPSTHRIHFTLDTNILKHMFLHTQQQRDAVTDEQLWRAIFPGIFELDTPANYEFAYYVTTDGVSLHVHYHVASAPADGEEEEEEEEDGGGRGGGGAGTPTVGSKRRHASLASAASQPPCCQRRAPGAWRAPSTPGAPTSRTWHSVTPTPTSSAAAVC